MIVALAGHVDHGKTSLVKALTGVDTDRLEEERRRGLTIDLGFAYTDLDGKRIGFVDVPGHHRFVHNMVAGVASRQFALLVIAADDGPMPQTREHLDILSMLGLRAGAVALTKVDLVPTQRVDEARAEITALLTGTFLEGSPCVAVSAATGHGLEELRTVLAAAPHTTYEESTDECFRLAIDRAFNVKGAGLVVTGTVHSGRTVAGVDLVLAPRGERVRVRSIRVQDRAAELALPGDRCALNIVGVDRDVVQRGMWLVAPETHLVTSRIVVRLEVLRSFPHAVRHWTQVHVHHATAHTTGRIALLDSPPIAPGMSARVEIELDQALAAKRGDRIVLRDHAASCTLGGGDVIAIDPPKTGRRKAERLARLDLLAAPTAAEALHALLSRCDDGIDAEAFRQTWNLKPAAFDQLVGKYPISPIDEAGRRFLIAAEHVEGADARITERLSAYHKAAPYSAGLRVDRLRQLVPGPTRLIDAALETALRAGKIAHTNGHYHIAAHRPKLAPQDDALLKRIAALLEGRQPPSIGDVAKQLRIDLATLHAFVDRMAALGLLVRVSETRCFLPDAIAHLKEIASKLSRTADGFTAAEFRDASGIGRNLAIDVLEHFDRRGVTRRQGERRRALHATDH